MKIKRSAMNRMRALPSLWPALVALLALAGLLRPLPAQAANITVAAGEVAVNNNGLCSLREAIINANTDVHHHLDCAPGSGADVIILAAGTHSVADSYASYSGGTGLPQITSPITIEGNGATIDRSGASVYRLFALSSTGNLTLNDLMLTDGAMTSDVGGGAIYNDGGTLTINDSFLSGHSATNSQGGGAIRSNGGTVTINTTTLSGNQSSNSNGGGAIYVLNGATLIINDSTLSSNTAANTNGGAIGTGSGSNSVTLNRSTVRDNTANGGAGIATGGGALTLNNSTLSGNQAQSAGGGGVHNNGATVTLNNTTVTGNTTTTAGGGILSNSGTLNLNRSIISGNTGNTGYDSGYEVVSHGTENANNYNIFGRDGINNNRAFAFSFTPGANDYNATDDHNNVPIGSILDTTLANNGGPTSTHALVAGSPAVDRAPSAACTAAPINGLDQRSYSRNVDGNASASANECDAGSFEYLSSPPPATGDIVIVKDATPQGNTVFDFTETIPGANSSFTLSDPSDPSETFDDVTPGSYTVTETGETGWTLDSIVCVDPDNGSTTGGTTATIDLDAGETVTCTFSNSRDTGTVVIQKEATPEDDTAFTFTANINPGGDIFTLSDPSDNIRQFDDVPTGSYLVNEAAAPGWTLDSIDCDDNDSSGNIANRQATINVQKGEVVTCVFNNSRDTGTITIVKEATPADSTPFSFTENIPGAGSGFTLSDPSDNSETFSNVPTGSYSVTESAVADWTLDSIVCVDPDNGSSTADATATIDLDDGETVTCTFNNSRDTGAITIVKAATPEDDTPFNFTNNIINIGFTLTDPSNNTRSFPVIRTGSYTVSEIVPAGWTLDSIVCVDPDNGSSTAGATATIDLDKNESITCTFNNSRDTGTITIVKEATPADNTPFSFTETIPGAGSGFTLSDPADNTETFSNVPTGSYSVTESAVAGWALDSIVCVDPDNGSSTAGATATIDLDDGETVTCTFNNTKLAADIFVSANDAGVAAGNVPYGPHDILAWDGSAWSIWFDGSDAGLMPSGPHKHDIDALWIPDPAGDDVVLSFVQNARFVDGISGKVNGMDLVWWDGSAFSLWFDGEDVGLTNMTQEKIDALHVLDGSLAPPALAASAGGSCDAYLLISTAGDGQVPNYSGGTIKFDGTDVLGFCLTQAGATTQGKWTRVLNGKAEGMPGQALVNLSASDDGQVLYFTTRATFNVDTAQGGHSMVYRYDFATGQFSGPFFSAPANGLSKTMDGLHVDGELP